MKRRILAFLLLFTMVLPMFGTLAFAEEGTEVPAWTANGTTVTEGEDGYHTVSGIEYAANAYTTEKVQLEGLTIEWKITNLTDNQAVGVIFSKDAPASFDSGAAAITLWRNPYANGQTRVHVGKNHDYNATSYAYNDEACTTAGFGVASSMVLNNVDNADIKIEITSHSDTAYKVKFTIAQDNLLWGNNCNYADEEGGGHSCTFYMLKSTFADALDSEGKLYVSASGLSSSSVGIKLTESDVAPTPTPDPEPDPEPTPDPEPSVSTIIGQTDSDWTQSFNTPAVMTFAENGYTEISNLNGWGTRAHYNRLVKLDGLELSLRAATNKKDCVGIVFASAQGQYFGETPFAITFWNALYDGQARLNFAANHSYDSTSVVYTTPDLSAATGFGVASSMVCNQAAVMGWTLKFESYNDEFYSIKITMTDGEMWGNNANYNAEEKSCTVYLPKATVAGILNENGELYVTAAGFPEPGNPAPAVEVKIVDDAYRAYISGEGVANAIAKVEAYKTAAAAITDVATYEAAMVARAEAFACAGDLRARELAELALIVTGIDAELAANDDIVAIVKKSVTDKIDAAKAAYDALKADPSTLNKESLAAALALANEAKAEYESVATLLNESAITEIKALLAELSYSHDYCIALEWIVTYQTRIAALNVDNPNLVNDLAGVKEYRAALETTTAYNKVTTVLNDDDKALFVSTLASLDEALAGVETTVLPQLKEKYVAAMEDKLAADLTIKPNLDDAKRAYAEIATYVTITEEDGELYNRYVAGYNALKAACEAYVRSQISGVSALLDVEYTILDEFKSVRNKFKSIKLDYLMEENADIAAELAELERKISANVFYYMNSTDIPIVEWNSTGLAVESKVEFPARLNYNKALSLKSGVEIVVELTSAAYYNDNTSANNLCFNLLAEPDSYKSMSDGISIIVWLYPTESNVQIMNNTDVPLANSVISTPIDGGTITISVKYEEYYSFVEDATYWAYVIRVNEAEIVLTEEALTNNGHTITDEVYFSMGSFADNKENPNILTLVSANGVEFGKPEEEKPECTEHVDGDADGKCDSCGADVEVEQPGNDNGGDNGDDNGDDGEQELTFIQKLARFFRSIVDAIVNFFTGLFGKK